MKTFLKKISCGFDFIIEFPAEMKSEFGIEPEAYVSFVISRRGAGGEVVFEKGKLAGNPDENWSLEITAGDLTCGDSEQVLENNYVYEYRLAIYKDGVGGKSKFYLECFLITKNIFSFDDVAYKAIVLSYAPGYYHENSTDSGVQNVRIPFFSYASDLTIDSKYLNPEKTSTFGFNYVIEEHGGQDSLVFKSGSYTLEYDNDTGLWYVPKEQLQAGAWEYNAQIIPTSWGFSTDFGWIDGNFLNAETGVAMHSYRRGFSYADEPSASGWTFGSVQTDNMDYEHGITAQTSDGLTGGPTQKLSVIQNAIKTTSDPDWAIFKSRYYNRYDIRGFQLNGVERTVDGSTYSLDTVDSPIISMDENLNGFIQGVELDTSGNSDLKSSICEDDLLHWTAVLDAQKRSVNVDWTIPSGYMAHWAADSQNNHVFGPSDFPSFDFDLDVPVGFGASDYFLIEGHDSWSTENSSLNPISKEWIFPKMYLESAGTYWVLAGFTRGGSTRFIQEGDVPGNIVEIANEPNHYLWNVGEILYGNQDTTGENLLVNNLDGNGTIYPIWGRARRITLTYSFDEASDESSSSYVPPVESSSSGEGSSWSSSSEYSSSSSWDENWATEGYLQNRLQEFVDYLGQIGKISVLQNLVSTSQIVSALDTVMENVEGLETFSSSSSSISDYGEAVNIGQVRNSFTMIESRFGNVSDMAYAYGSATGTQFTSASQFSATIYGLNNALTTNHSDAPTIYSGSGEIAFKDDVDNIFSQEISKYSAIASNVSDIKSDLDSEQSIGLVYLGNTTVSLCDALAKFGSPIIFENTRDIDFVKNKNVDKYKSVEKEFENENEDEVSNYRAIETREVSVYYNTYRSTVLASVVNFGQWSVGPEPKIIMLGDVSPLATARTVYETPGYKEIEIFVPTFVNMKQANDLGWDLNAFYGESSNVGWDEESVLFREWLLDGFADPGEKGLEKIEAEGEGVSIGRPYSVPNQQLKYLTTEQKVADGNELEWNFPQMRTLTLSNQSLDITANVFSQIGGSVQREPPFPEWESIYVLAGRGTKIIVNLGMTALMNLQGFPFGASTKHYFKCLDSNGGGIDAGYVIYDGTKWIKWRSLIPEDYFGPIPPWPNDVIDADNKYFNLTYNSNMDHGVVGQIPDWNNVETADNTFRVDGNYGNSPVCTSPGVWRQDRDTSSVYGSIPEWKNVTSANGTYYGQGFLDTVWDITRPFSEIMPSTVAHDENTVKGTSFALRVYFTSDWGGMLDDIDEYMTSHTSERACLVIISPTESHNLIQYTGTNGSVGNDRTSFYGDGGYSVTRDYIRFVNDNYRKLIKGTLDAVITTAPNVSWWGNADIEAVVACFDFSKVLWANHQKSSVKRVNVCSVNHDVAGFEDFTELAIVEIIPGTTTSGQHILDNCFKNCVKLETVILPNCMTVGAEAFSGCGKVSSVKLGLVSSFGENCFSGLGVDLIEN